MVFLLKAVFANFVVLKVVDFRSRSLAFRGACGEPPGALRLQESRTLYSNQLINEVKATIF
jgi:hypothetical protein